MQTRWALMQRRKQVDKVERGLVCAVDRHGTEWLAFVNFLDMNVLFFLSMVKLVWNGLVCKMISTIPTYVPGMNVMWR